MPIWILLSISALFSGCTGSQTAESRRQEPDVEYYINKNANEQSVRAIAVAFDAWQEVTDFSFTYAGRNRAGLHRDGKNTVSFLTEWPDDVPFGQTAWCRNWYDRRGSIIESDIILNMKLARFTTLETQSPDSYYIEGVMVHEIGHLLGLSHSENPASVMKPGSPPGESWFKGNIDSVTLDMYMKLYGKSSAQ